MKPSRELRDLVLGFHHDFANADPAAVDLLSQADLSVFIGTDPDEYLVGGPENRAVIRKQLTELGRFKIDTGPVTACEEGAAGWAACECVATMPNASHVAFRASYVFVREDGDWRIVQYHWSIGIANPEAIGIELTTSIDGIAELVDQERPDLNAIASPDGTVTIMFTDLEGSTSLNESLGDDTYVPLLLRHHEIVKVHTESSVGTIVKVHTESSVGTIVKSEGDGFMLAFPSARRAVDCAIAIQRDTARVDGRLKVRMGLHTGEPTHHAEDFFGRDVAYAARVGSAAVGGEILVSALVRSLVEPAGSVTFEASRTVDLKGFNGDHHVSAVLWS